MKSRQEIETKLKELQNTHQMKLPSANIVVNAPLALIQTVIESQISILKWVLKEKEKQVIPLVSKNKLLIERIKK